MSDDNFKVTSETSAVLTAETDDSRLRALIDASTRLPVLLFFGTAIFWLIAGTFLALLTNLKLIFPGFLDGCAFLTYGRLYPAQEHAILYGWASTAAMGVGIWLMARLCRVALSSSRLLVSACLAWNLGVFFGVLMILAGYGTGVQGLEFPGSIAFLLTLSFIVVALWVVVAFFKRRPHMDYISQWYLVASFLAFSWLFTSANYLLVWKRTIPGSAFGPLQFWFSGNILTLWLTGVALASVYFFIPKILGRPIHSYYLSIFGFWTLLVIAGWTGMVQIFGGPIPAWMGSVGVAAGLLMLIPIVTMAINHHTTMGKHFDLLEESPTLRFTVVGAIACSLTFVSGAILAQPTMNAILRFSDYSLGQWNLLVFGFFSMVAFGAMYYIVPRLTGWEWASAREVSRHFWLVAVGIGTLLVGSIFGGFLQGLALNDEGVTFQAVLNIIWPWWFLRAIGYALVLVGSLVFANLFIKMIFKLGVKREGPALFTSPKNV